MLLALLLMSMLGAPQATAVGPLPTHADAAALAGDGQYEAALEAFRRLAAADPGDHDARLWIARLHGWMGRPELAEPVYRSIMVENPSNLEATLGAGMTLVTLGRTDEAIETLERAESREPQNADVLAGLGLAHTLAGRTTRAVSYAERAVAIAPTDAHRQTLEQARLVHGHRVELTSFGERYDTPTSDTGSVDLRVNYRFREDLRLLARGQHQRKFGFSEQRGGAGLEWRWRPNTSLAGHVLVGPDTVVLPRVDVNAEIVHRAGDALWTAGYRFFDFPSAQVSVVSPGVTWWPSVRASLGLRYDLSLTDSPAVASAVDGHSLSLRGSYRVVPRIWVNAGYTRGTDNFETLSPDRVGDFRANTASAGLRFDLPSLTSVFGVYEHQWRPNTVQMGRLTISLMQRF
jgi:YaiO family outer membrane protein